MMSWLGVFYVTYRLIKGTDGSLLCQGGSGADAAGASVSDDYVGLGLIRETMKYCLRGRKRILNW